MRYSVYGLPGPFSLCFFSVSLSELCGEFCVVYQKIHCKIANMVTTPRAQNRGRR
jgi:hypothetical protein